MGGLEQFVDSFGMEILVADDGDGTSLMQLCGVYGCFATERRRLGCTVESVDRLKWLSWAVHSYVCIIIGYNTKMYERVPGATPRHLHMSAIQTDVFAAAGIPTARSAPIGNASP